MKARKAGAPRESSVLRESGVRQAIDQILGVLAEYGEVNITARVGGRGFRISVNNEDGEDTIAVRGPGRRRGPGRPPGSGAKRGRPPGRPAAGRAAAGRAATGAGSSEELPSAATLFQLIEESRLGLGLKELAAETGVKPRNLLKPILEKLEDGGKISKVGRKYRSKNAVVTRGGGRRGRKPGRPPGKPGRRPGRPPKAATKEAPARGRKGGRRGGRRRNTKTPQSEGPTTTQDSTGESGEGAE